jgi:DNA-binding transcriptional LysR family regulator
MMIDLRKIEMFLCAAENGNLSDAARQLHLSQPAVSHQIKLLEQELEVRLFIRTNSGLKLTEAGALLLPWARRILHDMQDLKDMMQSLQEVFVGSLRIACSCTAGKYILPALAARFRQRYPGVEVRILGCSPRHVTLNLLEGEAQLGVLSTEVHDAGLDTQEFFRDSIRLVVPMNHRWAARTSIEPAEIVQEPIILREESSGTRQVMMEGLSKFDISLEDLNIFMEVGNAEAVLELVAGGHGVSFVSTLVCRYLQDLGRIKSVAVDGLKLERTTYMVRKRISAPHRASDVFWGFVHAAENADLLNGPELQAGP